MGWYFRSDIGGRTKLSTYNQTLNTCVGKTKQEHPVVIMQMNADVTRRW